MSECPNELTIKVSGRHNRRDVQQVGEGDVPLPRAPSGLFSIDENYQNDDEDDLFANDKLGGSSDVTLRSSLPQLNRRWSDGLTNRSAIFVAASGRSGGPVEPVEPVEHKQTTTQWGRQFN